MKKDKNMTTIRMQVLGRVEDELNVKSKSMAWLVEKAYPEGENHSQTATNWKKRGIPTKDNFKVANLLGLNYHWLMTGEGDRYANVPIEGRGVLAIFRGETQLQPQDYMKHSFISTIFAMQDNDLTSAIHLISRADKLRGDGRRDLLNEALMVLNACLGEQERPPPKSATNGIN